MPDHSGYHLFTAADQPVEIINGRKEFEARLVHALLLEPGLVMVDAYFFSSPSLEEHVFKSQHGSLSLFEAAMRQQLVVPALRQPAKNFNEVLGYLRAQQLQGRYDSLDPLAYRLSQWPGLDAAQVLWPARVGLSYDKLMQLCLLGEQPSGVNSQIWQLTEGLRHRAITEARRITQQLPEGDGLRRGEVIRIAGSILGVFDLKDKSVIDRYEILSRYAAKVDVTSVNYRAAREFFDWIDEIHHLNFARSLEASTSLFAATLDTLAPLQIAMPRSPEGVGQQSSHDKIDMVVKIPSVQRLLAWPPENLLNDARDQGMDWRSKALHFLDHPGDETRHAAEEALEDYAKCLRKFSPKASHSELSVKAFAMQTAPALLTAASGIVPAVLLPAAVAPVIGPAVAAAGFTGYLAYRYFVKPSDKVRVQAFPKLNIIQASPK